jgi:hypothetical protein
MTVLLTTELGVKINFSDLLEIQIGSTNVMLDYEAAATLYRNVLAQLNTAEITRIDIHCTRTDNRILNFPMSRKEAQAMKRMLEWFILDD